MSIEAIQEVHTVKGVLPAEFGDTLGGHVNLVTRSGTNSWHGSLFENYEGAALSARFQTLRTKPGLVFNQFGGSFGGPIKRDKIFIFGAYEGYRERAATEV
jgi:outer membrane receptor for Fe3+-dicitrate